MQVKVTVRTPKNQAAKCIETQKQALLGYRASSKVKKQKLVKHNKFYWILEIEQKELPEIIKKCARGEIIIREFYKYLFKLLSRANKLATKFKKGIHWIRRWIKKRLKKTGQENQGMANYIDSMTDDQLIDFIKVSDREEMDKLLAGELITVKTIDLDKTDK